MLIQRTVLSLLVFSGILSISASAKGQFKFEPHLSTNEHIQRELQISGLLAQTNNKPTNCDNDTVLLFHTNNRKSVRVHRPRNNSEQLLMNVFDSNIANKKQADLAVSVPVNKISEKNKITYSAQLENRIYNATVWINSQSKIQAELTAMDQNKRELWREKGAGEVTLKLRVSE